MWLRWLVNSYVRDAVEKQLSDTVQQARGATADREPPAWAALPCQMAFVFALGIESGGLVDLLEDVVTERWPALVARHGLLAGRRVLVAETGVGRSRAARATSDLLKVFHPDWVVSAGFAGGLVPELRQGHILMADRLLAARGEPLEVGFSMQSDAVAATRGLHVGGLLTVDEVMVTGEKKRQFAQQFPALACDMETYAVGSACRHAKTRFLSVRVISDAVDDELPPELESLLGQRHWAGKLEAAAGAIFQRPGSVKDMWKLRELAIRGSDRLARFLVGVADQLPTRTDG